MKPLLKNRNLLHYLLSVGFSMSTSNMVQFVLSLYVLEITGSGLVFASVISIIIFPRLLLSPFAAVLGDRWDKKKALLGVYFMQFVTLATFSYIHLRVQPLSLSLIYVLVIILEVLEIFAGPFHDSMIPRIVSPEDLGGANSLIQLDSGIVNILTPFISGMLYQWIGVGRSFLMGLVLIFFAFVFQWRMSFDASGVREGKIYQFFKPLKDGVVAVKENKRILFIFSIAFIVNFFFSPFFQVHLRVLILEKMKIGTGLYGLLGTVNGVVLVLVPMVSVALFKKREVLSLFESTLKSLVFIFVAFCFFHLFYLQGLSKYGFFILSTVNIAILVAFTVVLNISIMTYIQQQVSVHFLARVNTLFSLINFSLMSLGNLLYGWLSDHFSIMVPVVLSTVGVLISYLLSKRKPVIEDDDPASQQQLQNR